MYKLILLLSVCLIVAFGCNTPNDSAGTVEAQGLNISFVDEQEADLLNPEHTEAITEENTDLYYLINGQKQRVYKGNLDHPKHFFISGEKLSDRYFMRVFPNIIEGKDTATTYIQFNDSSMDTIKVAYDIGNNVTSITNVWYNDKLHWDINGDDNNEENIEHVGIYFVVTKDFE